ncbi:hypothetical protein EVAR_34686_1 [Eumeta japonica]|uniref:Mariner Mos1 transposase n=1 Tax=Eumeta variegata TaxID=151549 RepID=A0A4C1VGB4_EUMVA|nr:hypothetical protein EVAR_34686_1 [Eumeta japonica]
MSAESSNLSNIEHRAVIKYFVKKGKRPKKFLKTWYQFFRNLALRIRWSKMIAYFNKDERAVKMILAQGVLHERQSYRSDVGSYRAECCFTRQCICPHGGVSRQALKDTGFSEIDHPPYSPDLAPSDYLLFPI